MNNRTPHKAALADVLPLIESLELPYLESLQGLLAEHITKRRQEVLADARNRIVQIAASVGLSLDELVESGGKKQYKPRGPLTMRYRDPASGLEWSGQGREPLWIKGKNRDDFRI